MLNKKKPNGVRSNLSIDLPQRGKLQAVKSGRAVIAAAVATKTSATIENACHTFDELPVLILLFFSLSLLPLKAEFRDGRKCGSLSRIMMLIKMLIIAALQ